MSVVQSQQPLSQRQHEPPTARADRPVFHRRDV